MGVYKYHLGTTLSTLERFVATLARPYKGVESKCELFIPSL